MDEGTKPDDPSRIVAEMAGAWRRTLGVHIDAHPGGIGTEAGQINRALRETARILCAMMGAPDDGTIGERVSNALRYSALVRMEDLGVNGVDAESLLDAEADLGDAWFAYLALAPESVIRYLLTEEGRIDSS